MSKPNPWDRVTVGIVTYNSAEIIGSALRNLETAPHVVIVDNASGDATGDIVRKSRPGVDIRENPRNMGLGTAVNQCFAKAGTEYALQLNPDATLSNTDLERLLATADANPNAGIVAPLLVDAEGNYELTVMGPQEWTHVPAEALPDGPFCTWFSIGAVWLVRLSAWREVGGFDESIFLYTEDADVCQRLTQSGHRIIVEPRAKALHLSGRSVTVTPKVRWIKDWHITWGGLNLERRWGDEASARRRAWRTLIKRTLKAALYVLLIRPERVLGNAAKMNAAWWFLRGRRARR